VLLKCLHNLPGTEYLGEWSSVAQRMSDIRMTSVDMAYGDDLNVVQEVTTEREVPCAFSRGIVRVQGQDL
jgi:hypothetical protein